LINVLYITYFFFIFSFWNYCNMKCLLYYIIIFIFVPYIYMYTYVWIFFHSSKCNNYKSIIEFSIEWIILSQSQICSNCNKLVAILVSHISSKFIIVSITDFCYMDQFDPLFGVPTCIHDAFNIPWSKQKEKHSIDSPTPYVFTFHTPLSVV